LLLAALLIPTIVCAPDYTGRVVGVINGGTIDVLNGHHVERIRLNGIDCPERENSSRNRFLFPVPGAVSCSVLKGQLFLPSMTRPISCTIT